MRNESTQVDVAIVPEQTVCDCCRLVPVSHLTFDLPEPIRGWETFLLEQGIDVMVDDCGRSAIARSVFGALVREHATRQKLQLERAALQSAEAARRVRVSAPAGVEGRSPYESMMLAEGHVPSPREEFSGREAPNFIAEQLDASAREIAERRRKRAEKAKEGK